MSTIRLGKINTNTTARDYGSYVATICRSDSGFLRPYLATDTLSVDTFFGSFPFKGMVCKFIEDGIPVLLLPMLTPMSGTNKCTLRLNDASITPDFPYAYPKYGRKYEPFDPEEGDPPDADVASGKKSYVHVLDFAKVTTETLEDYYSYVITRAGGTTRVAIHLQLPPPGEDAPSQPVVQSSYYNCRLPVPKAESDVKGAFVATVKDCINGRIPAKEDTQGGERDYVITGAECWDVFDIIIGNVDGFLTSNTIVITREDYDDSYGDSDGRVSHKLYPTFDAYKEAKWTEARTLFRSWMASRDYLLCDAMLAVDCCTSIFDDMSTDGGGYKEFDSVSESDAYLSEFEERLRAVPDDGSGYEWYGRDLPYYSLCVRNNTPVPILEFYNMEGFSTFTVRTPDMDAIARCTESSKVVEFYAKAKGSRGGGISVTIESVARAERCYRLHLSSGEYRETFDVTTAESTDDFMHIGEVGRHSLLVDAKLFNYRLSDGRRISTDDFEELAPEGEPYDGGRVETPVLPEGTWTLGRSSKEVFDYESACETLGVLSDSEFYPDFLLVNELDYGSDRHEEPSGEGTMAEVGEDRNYGYLQKLLSYAERRSTQVLVRVDEFIYAPPDIVRSPSETYPRIPTPLPSKGSRMLYFNGCYRHNGLLYPCFYPYAVNFLKGDYIKRLPYGVLYDVEGRYDKDLLSSKGINYLEYDNYCYCYKTVREPDGSRDPDAIVRFVASRISRVFLKGRLDFVGVTEEELSKAISDKVSRAKTLVPILGDVDSGYSIDGSYVAITVAFTIPSLVNKEYRLNITLTTT